MKNRFVFGVACGLSLWFLVSLIICCTNGFTGSNLTVFLTALSCAYHADVRIILGFIGVEFIMDKLKLNKKVYTVRDGEYKFLCFFRVKKWKDKYFAMDRSQFVIKDIRDIKSVEKVLRSNINAETTHWMCMFFSLFAILIGCLISVEEWWIYLLTTVVVMFIVDIPPIMIQRYNRYRLQRLYIKLERLESKKEEVKV